MQHQGHGAGEKKGVQEKLSGQQGHAGTPATGGTYGQQQGHPGVIGTGTHGTGEKKGVVENIKEKLPGGHQQTTGVTHDTTATGGTYGKQGHTGTTGTGEKKGIMDNVKDKLPGQH